ncbi:MAG: methionyl-tRNA formyltransferase [Myxococcota bacterium]
MRLAFFGTPDFAVPTLRRLLDLDHEVACVVSQPDRPKGRGRAVHPSPVSALALDAGLPLLRPARVAEPQVLDALRETRPELGIVVAFGQFLTKRVRELPARGYLINAHASLLPAWRGAAPIARAILAGETRTGISVMRVEREMDAGPVALVRSLDIGPDETCGELTGRLAGLAADAIEAALVEIAAERVTWTEQDHDAATLAPKITREDTHLDFREPAVRLRDRVRAMAPSPGARTRWRDETLLVLAAAVVAGSPDRPPGTVRAAPGEPLRIATGEGWLEPRTLQRAGGKPLPVDAFLRGRPIADGDVLGGDPRG